MAAQPPQWPRRIASPSSTKPPPMKATLVPISLRQGSPTRSNGRRSSPTSSPTPLWASDTRVKHRRSPDHRTSPERRSPTSPSSFNKVERPKPVRASPSSSIRRTSSLDTITGYLTGIWPRDGTNYGPEMKHKSTQTEWDDTNEDKKGKGSHKRSASWGSADQRIKEKLKHNIRKQGSRQNTTNNNRQSPVHGNHAAVQQQSSSTVTQAMPIPSPSIPKVPRARGSVEGLNQEIEKLVLTGISGINGEEVDRTQEPTPDGHRAPVPGMVRIGTSGTRSVDTQTPAGTDGLEDDDNNSDSSKSGSRSQSISPQFPVSLDGSQPGSRCSSTGNERLEKQGDTSPENQNLSKYASSPNHNKSYLLTREPPDGCEKVKIDDESRTCIVPDNLSVYGPDKRVTFILKPSRGSAFCPLLPNYPDLAVISPAQQNNNSTGIEGQ